MFISSSGNPLVNSKVREKATEEGKHIENTVQNPKPMNDALHRYVLTLPSLFRGLGHHFNLKSFSQISPGKLA